MMLNLPWRWQRLLSLLVLSAGLALGTAARAGEAAPSAEDPVTEARMIAIADELRCLVCQNESLASSRAELATDLRAEVRGLIRQGRSDGQIKDYLVERYGDFVLYRPAVKPLTWLLWFGPFVALVAGLIGMALYLRQRRTEQAPRALSEAERERARRLLDESESA